VSIESASNVMTEPRLIHSKIAGALPFAFLSDGAGREEADFLLKQIALLDLCKPK
jgi:hypothetical protein